MKAVYDASAFNVSENNSRHAVGSADGMLHAPAALPPQAASSTIFKQEEDKVTFEGEEPGEERFYRIHTVRCDSWMCKECRVPKGLRLKEKILKKAYLFKNPVLFTLTVDRSKFDSPEVAYDHIMKNKFISRLLKKAIGIEIYLWVLEAQQETGEGWPHWHILIDVSELPDMWYNKETTEARQDKPDNTAGWVYIPHFFDINRVRRLMDKWGIGRRFHLSPKNVITKGPKEAISYIMKYLIKPPKRGFPEWMLLRSRLRFFNPSNALGTIIRDGEPQKNQDPKKEKKPQKESRPPVDRIAECKKKIFFSYYSEKKDKMIFTKPIWGDLEATKQSPGIIESKDFDFQSQNEYTIWGFKRIKHIYDFILQCSKNKKNKEIMETIRSNKKEYLYQWKITQSRLIA